MSNGYTGPGLFPSSDSIVLANILAPGKWTLQSAPKVFGWDIRKGTALSGASVVPSGDELVLADFLVELWDDTQFPLFELFRAAYLKKPILGVAGAPVSLALGISHPELKALGVTAVVVKEVSPLVNNGKGLWSCHVKFLQYRKPRPALARPDASIPDNGVPTPTAQTQGEIELQEAQAKLAADLAVPPPVLR
jgi:hypothetical protein